MFWIWSCSWLTLIAEVHDGCTVLNQPVHVHGNADGQCYDADDQRDGQLDDHEEQHCQATADANHVVHEAGEYGKPTEKCCYNIAVKDTPIRNVVEYQIELVPDSEEYREECQAHKSLAESPCLVVAAEYQGNHASHSLENCHVRCRCHNRKYLN